MVRNSSGEYKTRKSSEFSENTLFSVRDEKSSFRHEDLLEAELLSKLDLDNKYLVLKFLQNVQLKS